MKRFGSLFELAVSSVAVVLIAIVLVASRSAEPQRVGSTGPQATADATQLVASQRPTSDQQASAVPVDSADLGCGVITAVLDGVVPTVVNESNASTDVIIGNVAQIGEAVQLLGPDATAMQRRSPWQVYRPVTINLTTSVKGASAGKSIDALLPGGTIGCLTFEIDGMPDELAIGQSFAFFADHGISARPASLRVFAAWPVLSDARIQAPSGTTLDVATFEAQATGKG